VKSSNSMHLWKNVPADAASNGGVGLQSEGTVGTAANTAAVAPNAVKHFVQSLLQIFIAALVKLDSWRAL
jgi:hypothetical protein